MDQSRRKKQQQKRRQIRQKQLQSYRYERRKKEIIQGDIYEQLIILLQKNQNMNNDSEKWIIQLVKFLHQHVQDYSKISELLSPQAASLYQLIISNISLNSLELLSILLKSIGEKELSHLLDKGLLGFLKFMIEQSNYARSAILSLSELIRRSSRQKNFREFIIFNGLVLSVQKALKASRELAGVSCVFFQSITFHPLNPILSEDLIKTHIVFLKDIKIPKDHLLNGLCNCLKWSEKWVNDLLSGVFVQSLIEIAAYQKLLQSQVNSVVYTFLILSTHPTQHIEWLRPYIKPILEIFENFLEVPKPNSDVFFILSNLLGDITLAEEIKQAIVCSDGKKNILKSLVSAAKRNDINSIEALTALFNFLNLVDLQDLQQKILASGLLEMVHNKINAAALYSEGEIELVLEVLESILDSPSLSRIICKSGMQELLEPVIRKHSI